MFWKKKKDLLTQVLDYNKDGLVNIQDIVDASNDLEKSLKEYRDKLKKQVSDAQNGAENRGGGNP